MKNHGFAFTNPVMMAALSATPLEQRGMLAGVFPVATNFGTAFFVALLTAGMTLLMNNYMAGNTGATEASALSYALAILSWISLVLTLVTYFVSTKLPKPEASQSAQQAAAGASRR